MRHTSMDNSFDSPSQYFGVVTLLPEIFSGWSDHGVISRAIREGIINIDFENPRDYSTRSANAVDDKPYGGGPGMVMQLQPVCDALAQIGQRAPAGSRRIVLAPHGRQFDQEGVDELLQSPGIVFICGRYEGIDTRLEQRDDIEVWSIGNFILSGGELAAMAMIESIARHIPGVLGDAESARQDSFIDDRLDCPHYTRPAVFAGLDVPKVLTGGNHADIVRWRYAQALGRMWDMRSDLVHNLAPFSRDDWMIIYKYLRDQQENRESFQEKQDVI